MEQLLVTRKEAAALLIVSLKTLDKLRDDGFLKGLNIGARVYYTPDELRAFITKDGVINA